jgi:hypothetical protein
MKSVIFAAALLVSGAALAQETDTTTDTTVTTTETTVMTGTPTTVAPSNAAPERDARGIPVISDAAVAPAGANQAVVVPPGAQVVPNPNQAAAFQTQASTDSYPACSRTVTDNCVQTYERPHR